MKYSESNKIFYSSCHENTKYYFVDNNSGYPAADYFDHPQVSGYVLREGEEKNSANEIIKEYQFRT